MGVAVDSAPAGTRTSRSAPALMVPPAESIVSVMVDASGPASPASTIAVLVVLDVAALLESEVVVLAEADFPALLRRALLDLAPPPPPAPPAPPTPRLVALPWAPPVPWPLPAPPAPPLFPIPASVLSTPAYMQKCIV